MAKYYLIIKVDNRDCKWPSWTDNYAVCLEENRRCKDLVIHEYEVRGDDTVGKFYKMVQKDFPDIFDDEQEFANAEEQLYYSRDGKTGVPLTENEFEAQIMCSDIEMKSMEELITNLFELQQLTKLIRSDFEDFILTVLYYSEQFMNNYPDIGYFDPIILYELGKRGGNTDAFY